MERFVVVQTYNAEDESTTSKIIERKGKKILKMQLLKCA